MEHASSALRVLPPGANRCLVVERPMCSATKAQTTVTTRSKPKYGAGSTGLLAKNLGSSQKRRYAATANAILGNKNVVKRKCKEVRLRRRRNIGTCLCDPTRDRWGILFVAHTKRLGHKTWDKGVEGVNARTVRSGPWRRNLYAAFALNLSRSRVLEVFPSAIATAQGWQSIV